MERVQLEKRRESLLGGLSNLERILKDNLKAIEIQKGAIGEVDYWIEEVVKEKEEEPQESTMEIVEDK